MSHDFLSCILGNWDYLYFHSCCCATTPMLLKCWTKIIVIMKGPSMNFFNPCHDENRSEILFIGSSLILVNWECSSAVDFTSGSAGETSRTGLCAVGQDDSGCHRKSGPLSHWLLCNRASVESPWDASSIICWFLGRGNVLLLRGSHVLLYGS